MTMHPPANPSVLRVPNGLVAVLLVLPWIHPWAPGPQSNTIPMLISWGSLAILLMLARWPSAIELAQTWAFAALVSSVMGLLQYFGEASHWAAWMHVPEFLGDAVGNLRQRNQLATLTSIGAVAVLWWHAHHGLRTAHAIWMMALLALGNAATGSRTGLLQWFLLPILAGLWQGLASNRRPVWSWSVLLCALALYLGGSVVLPQALAAWQGTEISSALVRMGEVSGCGSRSVLWSNVLHLISQKPWTGWGWNELKYAHYMATYPGPRFCDILGNAHNLPLHLAFAFGVPVALAALGAVIAIVLRARPWQLSTPESSLAWGVMALIGLHSLLEYPLWYGPFQLALLWSVLLLWPAGGATLARYRLGLQALGMAGLCLIALMAWDYHRTRQIYLAPALRSSLWQNDPWQAARNSWFFSDAVRFAEVTSTPVTPDNAESMLDSSLKVLHYSPEPRVIDKLIDSARLLGQDALADRHQAQKQAVYGKPANTSAN